jgi:hypothetical protein
MKRGVNPKVSLNRTLIPLLNKSSPYLVIIFTSYIFADLFLPVLYTDDYWAIQAGHLETSPLETFSGIIGSTSPTYSVWISWISSSVVFGTVSTTSYAFCWGFINWYLLQVFAYRNFGIRIALMFLFVALFIDPNSHQMVFWSLLAVNSFSQHLIPIIIFHFWLRRTISSIQNSKFTLIEHFLFILLLGFPGEILLALFFTVSYLLLMNCRQAKKLFPIGIYLTLCAFMIIASRFSPGSENRAKLLDSPDSIDVVISRVSTFLLFFAKTVILQVILCIFIGFVLSCFGTRARRISNCVASLTIQFTSLFLGTLVVCVYAYQSVYHFVGLYVLGTALGLALGIEMNKATLMNIDTKTFPVIDRLAFSAVALVTCLIFSSTNLNYARSESERFWLYIGVQKALRANSERLPHIFRDTQGNEIGPNIPSWKSYSPFVFDYTDMGILDSYEVWINGLRRDNFNS